MIYIFIFTILITIYYKYFTYDKKFNYNFQTNQIYNKSTYNNTYSKIYNDLFYDKTRYDFETNIILDIIKKKFQRYK